MMLSAYAPASIGNVSLGFDVLGAALAPVDGSRLGDEVKVAAAETFSLSCEGRFANKLPGDASDNIVTRCYQHFHHKLTEQQGPMPAAALTLSKNLPIGSGLGSSASSIVAALHGLNQFYQSPFSEHQLLLMMGELEGQISGSVHYDNVAPCFLGGMTLMVEHGERLVTQLPVFEHWYWVVCYSGISVSTSAARDILPRQVSLGDTITFGRQLGVFVDALHRRDEALAAAMMQDVIAEPHRKSLLPGFDASRDFAMQQGALAFGISGSGPTVFAACGDEQSANRVNRWLAGNYIQNETGFSHVCRIDTQGASIQTFDGSQD